jgi:hypothetical protein
MLDLAQDVAQATSTKTPHSLILRAREFILWMPGPRQ